MAVSCVTDHARLCGANLSPQSLILREEPTAPRPERQQFRATPLCTAPTPRFYEPKDAGFEKEIKARLEKMRRARKS